MTTPTTPAPMTAERLEEIRSALDSARTTGALSAPRYCVHHCGFAGELIASHDAITARIAELERALGEERSLTVDQIELCADLDAAVERALAAEAALKEAERRADAETNLRQGVEEAADELTEAWKRRALAAESKPETARRDALEEAAEVCDGVARRCNERGMYGVGVLFEASKAIRALAQKDTAP